MHRLIRAGFVVAVTALGSPALAQPAELNSHEVNADHSVTFRYDDPAAKQVTLLLDYSMTPIALQKGAEGIWTHTTQPLQPELHFYTFVVDGVALYDPRNPDIKANFIFKNNEVRVPGAVRQLWDLTNVPHGVVHRHLYESKIITGLTDGQEEYYVYTPPGYDSAGSKSYPVLYLLHGWSGGADDWVAAGQLNLMLDNLIAQGRAVPMIAVMPQSYGAMSFVRNGFKVWDDPAQVDENVRRFDEVLLQEIGPQVDRAYRVNGHHAITGISMGGGQSLLIGLNHPEYFGWVGGFSSALPATGFDGHFPKLSATPPPALLWVSCGLDEPDLAVTRKFVKWLRAKGLSPAAVETPGIHNWHTWRDNFAHFAPLLFRPATTVLTDEQQLLELEQAWVRAEGCHDTDALQRILDAQFVGTFGTGEVLTKGAFIAQVTGGTIDPTLTQTLSDRIIIINGDTAILVDTDTVRRTKDGKPVEHALRVTTTYIRRQGRWYALAEQTAKFH